MATYFEEVTADSPSVWYRLEGNTNNSGSLSPAAMTGTIAAYTNEGAGRNADFDAAGGSGVVTTSNGNNFFAARNEPYTIEFWVKGDTVAAFTHMVTLGLSSGHHIIFYKDDTGDINVFFYGENGSTSLFEINATQNVDDGNWHHVVLVHTTSSGTGHVNLYWDGALAYNPNTTHETGGTPIIAGTLRLAQDGSAGSRYAGLLDEVAVYKNVALSGARITAHYNAGALEFGPNNTYVAAPMTGSGLAVDATRPISATPMAGSGESVDPVISTGSAYSAEVLDDDPLVYFPFDNNLTNFGSESYSLSSGTAVYDAEGHYSESTHSLDPGNVYGTANLFASRPTDATIEVWIKATSVSSTQYLVAIGTGANMYIRTTSGAIGVKGFGTGSTSFSFTNSGEWQQLVLVKDSDDYTVYQNGEEVDTFTASGGSESDWDLSIGGLTGGSVFTQGLIDAVSVYDTALSAERVLAHYLAGVDPVNDGYTAEVMAGSGLFNDPTVSGTANVSADEATGSGEFVDPDVVIEGTVNFPATPFLGSGLFPNAAVPNVEFGAEPMLGSGEFAEPAFGIGHTADPMLGDGEINDVTLDLERHTVVFADEMNGSGTMKDPTNVNPFENDPYYAMIRGTTDTDDHWMGLDEISGNQLRMYYGGPDPLIEPGNNPVFATIYGDYTLGIDGPAGRTGVRMNDGYIVAPNVFGFASGQTITLEAVIRTSADNGLLFMSKNERVEGVIVGQIPPIFTAVYIQDGRLVVHTKRFDGVASETKLVGNTPINDGEWHHIVVTEGTVDRLDPKNFYVPETGVRFYIDGDLDARLSPEKFNVIWSVRQAAGLPPGWIYNFDVSSNFVGDITEIVARKEMALAHETVKNLSYPALGIIPVHIDPFVGSGEMTQSVAAGNRKRALLVRISSNTDQWDNYQDTYFQPIGNLHYDTADPGQISFGGELYDGKSEMFETLEANGQTDLAEMLDYHWFETNARGPVQNPDGSNPDQLYRDDFDTTRLINFMTDIDPDEWDLVAFADYPDKGMPNRINVAQLDFGYVGGATMAAAAERMFEDMIDSLQEAIVGGLSVLVTNPALARDLGVISGHDEVPTLRRTDHGSEGYPTTGGGFREFSVDPFATDPPRAAAASGGAYVAQLGKYLDQSANNRYRLAAVIDGLTDIPGYVLTDYLLFNPVNYFRLQELTMRQLNRMAGLQIGDEWLIEDSLYATVAGISQALWTRYDRHDGGTVLAAVHPDKILAGTAVTKLANTIWSGTTNMLNPYREYATTIAVQPGDELDGEVISGKVFVSLAEDAENLFTSHRFQNIDSALSNASRIDREEETDYSESFQYSTQRTFQQAPILGQINNQFYLNPSTGRFETISKTEGAQAGQFVDGYHTTGFYSPTMVGRGMIWLGEAGPGEDDTLISADAMEGEAELVMPDVEAKHDVVIGADILFGSGSMLDADEGGGANASNSVLPMVGFGQMSGHTKHVLASPMIGFGLVPDYDIISSQGEAITLYLTTDDFATLYLKEVS